MVVVDPLYQQTQLHTFSSGDSLREIQTMILMKGILSLDRYMQAQIHDFSSGASGRQSFPFLPSMQLMVLLKVVIFTASSLSQASSSPACNTVFQKKFFVTKILMPSLTSQCPDIFHLLADQTKVEEEVAACSLFFASS